MPLISDLSNGNKSCRGGIGLIQGGLTGAVGGGVIGAGVAVGIGMVAAAGGAFVIGYGGYLIGRHYNWWYICAAVRRSA